MTWKKRISETGTLDIVTSDERTFICQYGHADSELRNECEKTGSLIAAAPELLAALKEAAGRVEISNREGKNILSAWLPEAKATIAKAEGRE